MGFRCSILGHEFGDAELQREREERGDEVVVTIREVRICERCGVQHVESESTEVRPVEPVEEVAGDPAADAGADGDADAGLLPPNADDAEDADPEVVGDAAPSDPEGVGAAGERAAAEEAESPAAEEDDGIILGDDEGVPADRRQGEWPRADDTRLDERDPPPEREAATGSDDAGDDPGAGIADPAASADASADGAEAGDEFDAAGEDAEILGESPGDSGAVPTNGESDARSATTGDDWPEHEDTPDEGFAAENGDGEGALDVEFSGLAPETDSESGADGRPQAPALADSVSLDAEDGTVFVCGECGFSEPVERSSLRAGDICPDCRAGYLHEVTPDEK